VCHWHTAGSLCWPFPMLKYKYIFADKIYGSNFIKQHSETVMVWNYQNADCSLKKSIYCVIYYNFRHTFVPYMGPDPPMEREITCWLPEIYTILLQSAMFSWRYPCDPVTADYENKPFEVILGPFIRKRGFWVFRDAKAKKLISDT